MQQVRKVAHILENLNQGGIARVVLPLVDQMDRLGIETHILLLKKSVEFDIAPSIRLRQLPIYGLSDKSYASKRIRHTGCAIFGRRRYWHLASGWFATQLQRQIAEDDFDCIFCS